MYSLYTPIAKYVIQVGFMVNEEDNQQLQSQFNPFRNKPWFLRVCNRSLLKTQWEKGTIARNKQFLLFPQYFLSFWRTLFYFHQILKCRLQALSVWKSLKFVVWVRVNKKEKRYIVHCNSD